MNNLTELVAIIGQLNTIVSNLNAMQAANSPPDANIAAAITDCGNAITACEQAWGRGR